MVQSALLRHKHLECSLDDAELIKLRDDMASSSGVLVTATALYLTWAAVVSDSLFHRVWSLALAFLEASIFILPHVWPSSSAYFLVIFIIVDAVFCLALSPLQRFIVPASPRHSTLPSIEDIPLSEIEDVNLNHLPILADVVAVHGLGSNPSTTWQSRSSSSSAPAVSWLRDLLPRENLRCRILLHNHNTRWDTSAINKSLQHYGDDLLRGLRRVRAKKEDWTRPLIFIGHSFGGLIIKQMLVNASTNVKDDFCREVLENTKGIIFLGTPHKGAHLTLFGGVMSLFGHWTGASTSLLEVIRPHSSLNESLHSSFMQYLQAYCGVQNTLCVFETLPETVLGFPITQVVDRNSAVIDGSHLIGFEQGHRDIQRFPSADDENYKDLVLWIQKWTNDEQAVKMTPVDAEVLSSLAFPEMLQRRSNIGQAYPNTCQWILTNPTYRSWESQSSGLLWIKGKPGSGKSTLMSFIYDAMKGKSINVASIRLDFFFNGHGAPLQRSFLGMIRALLNQLYRQCPMVRSEIRQVFEEKRASFGSNTHQWEWQQRELEDLFLQAATMTAKSQRLVIFVDALDEAGDLQAREIATYFHRLNDLLPDKNQSRLGLCISCRPYPISSIRPGAEIRVEDFNGDDIVSFIRDRMDIANFGTEPYDERAGWDKLVEELIQRAAGVFQWVCLVVLMAEKYKSKGLSSSEVRHRLREVPPELGAVYRHILEHVIDREDRPRTLLLLRWVCLANGPLTVEELRYAMAAATGPHNRLGDQHIESLVDTNERMERLAVSLSGGLVETINDNYQSETTVQVIHQSVNDFLVPEGLTILSSLVKELEDVDYHGLLESNSSYLVHHSHGLLFRRCLDYVSLAEIQFEKDSEFSIEGERMIFPAPFIRYATTQLFQHAKQSNEQYFKRENFTLQLNELQSTLPKWIALFRAWNLWGYPAKNATMLHIACQFGLNDIVTELIGEGTNLELEDDRGDRALHLAAKNGHMETLKAMLEAGAEVGSAANDGQTPLMRAAGAGHEDIVRLLFARGARIDQMTEESGSALYQAAQKGKFALVLFLITCGAEVNAQGGYFGNALQAASLMGHDSIVRLLIEKGADVNAPQSGSYGSTLQAALAGGHESIVRLLIEKGASVNAQGDRYSTALQAASARGHESIVRLLIDEAADVNAQGGQYGSALKAASWFGRESIVRLLIEKGAEVDARGGDYSTALQAASAGGYDSIVRLLIENGADINGPQSGYYGTALQAASARGYKSIVGLLIEGGAEVNAQGGKYGSALQAAIVERRDSVVRLLIEKGAGTET